MKNPRSSCSSGVALAVWLVVGAGLALVGGACSGSGLEAPPEGDAGADGASFGDTTALVDGATNDVAGDALAPIDEDTSAAGEDEVIEDTGTGGGPAGEPDVDDGPVAGDFLAPCDDNDDCFSGLCVDHLGTQVCTKQCDTDCPAGWECQQIQLGGPDVTWACISPFQHLCRPCASKADCSSLGIEDVCVEYGAQGSFCGATCDGDSCPDGYSCEVVETSEGATTEQCVADAGVCVCSAIAVELALTTPCTRDNELGSCVGLRTCSSDGLTACDAAVPAAEVCNGLDDDCDGATDEDDATLCDDGNPCSADTCNGELGECEHVPTPGDSCDDGDVCTLADHCEGDVCVGSSIDCDDGNPCTGDSCNPTGGCIYTFNNSACDDGEPCTVQDSCQQGVCAGAAIACECENDSDCLAIEDGDVCNGTLFCDTSALPWRCAVDENTVVTCEDPEGSDAPCLVASCDPFSGECGFEAAGEGDICDDGDACTVAAHCAEGSCGGGLSLNCEDGNACTDDGCDPATGCTHAANSLPCSDGDTCTVADQCAEGGCASGAALDCDDGNPCTVDTCDPDGGCQHAAADGGCDDGNACTTGDTCVAGSCTFTGFLDCGTGEPCVAGSCDPLDGCVEAAADGPCSDDDPCTLGDTCADGVCVAGPELVCDDSNPCTTDACVPPGLCAHAADDGAECNDGNACTEDDGCSGGSCIGAVPTDCDDGDVCTDDSCTAADGCTHTDNSSPCDDDEPCTVDDTCSAGTCEGVGIDCECELDTDCAGLEDGDLCTGTLVCDTTSTPYTCVTDPQTVPSCPEPQGVDAPCLVAACDPATGGCDFVAAAEGAACDDGDACTTDDTCMAGSCVGGVEPDCDDGNACTDDSCDVQEGCVSAANTEPCDDGNACTTGELCADGGCGGGVAVDCGDDNPCTDDLCVPSTGCAPVDNEAPCSDGDPCTAEDACVEGDCVSGTPIDCDDDNVCTDDACVAPGVCEYIDADGGCDDGNHCTESDTCVSGTCLGLALTDCDDGDVCTDNWCSTLAGGCQEAPNEALCDDDDACTEGDVCADSVCTSGAPLDCDDGELCTDDDCEAESGCTHTDNTVACDDEDACTEGDVCSEGGCTSGAPVLCDDEDDCTVDSCDTVEGCSTSPAADGTPCTEVAGGTCSEGACECTPDCEGIDCGGDGCGGSCGTCAGQDACIFGQCVCQPECTGLSCGSDGCGGDCGTCGPGLVCDTGSCVGLPCGSTGVAHQGGCVWSQPGNDTFNVPSGVSSVVLTLIGGGGGSGTSFYYPGGGGGSGYYTINQTVLVTPGSSISVTVGSGGGTLSAGGTSSFGAVSGAGGNPGNIHTHGRGQSSAKGGNGGSGGGAGYTNSSNGGGVGSGINMLGLAGGAGAPSASSGNPAWRGHGYGAGGGAPAGTSGYNSNCGGTGGSNGSNGVTVGGCGGGGGGAGGLVIPGFSNPSTTQSQSGAGGVVWIQLD